MGSVEQADGEDITTEKIKSLLVEIEAEIKNMFKKIMDFYKTQFGADLFGAGSDIENLDWLKRIAHQRHLICNLMAGTNSGLFIIEEDVDRNNPVEHFQILMSIASICAMLEMEQAETFTAVRNSPEYVRPTNFNYEIYRKMMRIKAMLNSLGFKTAYDD